MNQKIKQAGLFAILAVFTISLTTSFVGDAEASPQSRGDITSEPVKPSSKALQRAQASSFDPVNTGAPGHSGVAGLGETPEPSIKAQQRAQALDQ